MSEFTLQRNHIKVIYVIKPLVSVLTLAVVRQYTLARNPINVMNVEESSTSALTFMGSREFTLKALVCTEH